MIQEPRTHIRQDLCIGCGLCVTVCPSDTLTISDHKARVTGETSMYCGHCEAICPTSAITVTTLDGEYSTYHTFKTDKTWTPYGKTDTGKLVNLMASRRSCRNYKNIPVHKTILEDLVKIGTTAPSGTNSQLWTFTIIPDRDSMEDYAVHITDFYKDLNIKARKGWLRNLLKLFGNHSLSDYYQNYYQSVEDAIKGWEENRVDKLFHGAQAAILIGASKGASCPGEDALLATQNILLGSHSMGLGSCLIGFAVEAMKHKRGIKEKLGIPADEKIYSVIALGYPDEIYQKVSRRHPVTPRYVSSK